MKQFILALGLAGVMVPLVSPTSQQQQQLTATEPTNADWDWFGRLHRLALDALMPLDRPRGALVAYRSYHDLDHPSRSDTSR